MQQSGQIVPIIVRQKGYRYELVDGLARLHAASILGWQEIDARVVV